MGLYLLRTLTVLLLRSSARSCMLSLHCCRLCSLRCSIHAFFLCFQTWWKTTPATAKAVRAQATAGDCESILVASGPGTPNRDRASPSVGILSVSITRCHCVSRGTYGPIGWCGGPIGLHWDWARLSMFARPSGHVSSPDNLYRSFVHRSRA